MNLMEIFFNNTTVIYNSIIASYVQDVQETVFVSLIHLVDHGVDAEDVGKVDVAKDVGQLGRGVIHI